MKRIVLSLATVAALVLGGVFATKAEAHHPPHHHHHHHHCPPRYSYGYGAHTGYPPYNVYRAHRLARTRLAIPAATSLIARRIRRSDSAYIWASSQCYDFRCKP